MISLIDTSLVIDLAGNELALTSVKVPLKEFTNISETDQQTMDSGGLQLQLLVLLLFGVQLTMRLLLKSTMQRIWEVVHQMQFLYFLVVLPVSFPLIIPVFVSWFDISTGNLDDLSLFSVARRFQSEGAHTSSV